MRKDSDDEMELLLAWRAGDKAAGETLFERYVEPVTRFFRSKLDRGAEDLVQQTFLACVEGKTRMRTTSFRSYLFGAAHNLLRDHLRRRHRDRMDPSTSSAEDLGPSASALIVQHEEDRLLLAALRRIPLDYQIAIELHYWERLSGAEIAEALEVPEGTIRSRLRRGLARVREEIATIEAEPSVLESTMLNLERWAELLRGDDD